MDWDCRYQNGDIPWDKGTAAPSLAPIMARPDFTGNILVTGCGHGHDAAALVSPSRRVVGFDISETALDRARAQYSMPNLEFIQGDLRHPPENLKNAFDWIVEHTCLCALDPEDRPAYVNFARHCLRPGGRIFAIVFENLGEAKNGPPFATPGPLLQALFHPYFTLVDLGRPASCFPGREGEEQLWLMEPLKNAYSSAGPRSRE